VRPTIGLAAVSLLLLSACSPGGTPAPSAVTITPSLHWASPTAGATTPTTTSTGTGGGDPSTPRPSRRTPQPLGRSLPLAPDGIGTLLLGSATPEQARKVLDDLLGAPQSTRACDGRATITAWADLAVTFSGVPPVAQAWQVDATRGPTGLRLPRGTQWRPDRDALLGRPDAVVTTSGSSTVVTLADGFRYTFGAGDQRARSIGAGPVDCS